MLQKDFDETFDGLLEDDEGETTSKEPDENGVYWTEDCSLESSGVPCYFSGTKRYGKNVVLTWQADGQELDSTWDRLNTVLEGLPD